MDYDYAFSIELSRFAVAIGLLISIAFYEKFKVSPGGMIVPGFVALFFNRPSTIAYTLLVSYIIYFFVTRFVSRVAILYGRRKFSIMVFTGIVFSWLAETVLSLSASYIPFPGLQVVGLIIPGLIANEFQREEDVPKVTFAVLIISFLTYTIVNSLAVFSAYSLAILITIGLTALLFFYLPPYETLKLNLLGNKLQSVFQKMQQFAVRKLSL